MSSISPVPIAFFGTPEFSVLPLVALAESELVDVKMVVTQPDRQSGRGQRVIFNPVKATALELGITNIAQPHQIDDSFITELAKAGIDRGIVVAAGHIFPRKLCDYFGHKLINIHASLLPRHRGASPISEAILTGDSATGVTLMEIQFELDAGPILAQSSVDIQAEDTTGSLSDKLSDIGTQLLKENLAKWLNGDLVATQQHEPNATYAPKVQATDAEIDWNHDGSVIERMVRAYSPWPTAYTFFNQKRLRLHRSNKIDNENVDSHYPGLVYRTRTGSIAVATGGSPVQLLDVQLEGKKMMAAEDFANGMQHFIGSVLGT